MAAAMAAAAMAAAKEASHLCSGGGGGGGGGLASDRWAWCLAVRAAGRRCRYSERRGRVPSVCARVPKQLLRPRARWCVTLLDRIRMRLDDEATAARNGRRAESGRSLLARAR